ncbi:hypothetical protein ES703_70176 [subsurface metagenome]
MVVCHLHNSTVRIHVVSPKKVERTVNGKNRCPGLIVLEPGHVLAFVNRPGEEFDCVMVCSESYRIDIARTRSVRKSGTVPEVVGAYRIDRIKNANLLVQIGLSRMQSHPYRPSGPLALFQITDFEVG